MINDVFTWVQLVGYISSTLIGIVVAYISLKNKLNQYAQITDNQEQALNLLQNKVIALEQEVKVKTVSTDHKIEEAEKRHDKLEDRFDKFEKKLEDLNKKVDEVYQMLHQYLLSKP
jgi:peptidoglycan hydrolase CwlO-like protein